MPNSAYTENIAFPLLFYQFQSLFRQVVALVRMVISKLVYSGRKFYEENHKALTADCTDEEFMAIYENYPEADDLDDEFILMEEKVTETVARYIDEHLQDFAEIEA